MNKRQYLEEKLTYLKGKLSYHMELLKEETDEGKVKHYTHKQEYTQAKIKYTEERLAMLS